MMSKKDMRSGKPKHVNLKGNASSSSVHWNDDSGYSSDTSFPSASSLKLKHSYSNASVDRSCHFPTPDVTWKMKLRYSSTPHIESKCEVNELHTPDFNPIEGPLLRSKTYPVVSGSSPVFDCNLSLNIPSKSETSLKLNTEAKEKTKTKDKVSRLLIRSPLKSPFKLHKKPKSAEDISTEVFNDPEVRQRTVKALFSEKSPSPPTTPISKAPLGKCGSLPLTPSRRVSPRLSNILMRLMTEANYILPSVFSFLDDQDLFNVSNVCKQFRAIVEDSIVLRLRRKLFLEKSKQNYERIGKENLKNKALSNTSSQFAYPSPRKHLQQLQNYCISPQKITSPVKPLSRFDKFVKEGKKLLPGECQQKCISCLNPASISPLENKASCTNELCGIVYCTRCLMPYHEKPSDCLALKPKPRIFTASKILSKACKKRLRRL